MKRFFVFCFSFVAVGLFVAGCSTKESIKVQGQGVPESDATSEYIGPAEGSAQVTCIGPFIFGSTGNVGSIAGGVSGQRLNPFAKFGCHPKVAEQVAKYQALNSVPNADSVMETRVEKKVKGGLSFFPIFLKVEADFEGEAFEVQP